MREFRLSAAGIVLHHNKVLLVRYKNKKGGTFLVGPGGGVEMEESLEDGLKREIWEEARLKVEPGKILLVEDLLSSKYRMIKVWFLCEVAEGDISNKVIAETEEAKIEGIINVSWCSREQLDREIVYPEVLKNFDWNDFLSNNFETKYLPLTKADF